MELDAQARLVRGCGVGVTGPSLPYGLDSAENWDNEDEGDCSRIGVS